MGFLNELKETAEHLGERVEEALDSVSERLKESTDASAAIPAATLEELRTLAALIRRQNELVEAILQRTDVQNETLMNLYRDLGKAIEHTVPELSR